ncbi:hypothetical protein [Sphingomonas sp. CLY1604]|uniref:hypothetical protein n=1 Tax=Sphingomonas sp. CLY1604 TaxID=3457786 RepID=UPI003FD84E2F
MVIDAANRMLKEDLMEVRKDRSLNELAAIGNVAQFVSFAPVVDGPPRQTYSRVARYEANHHFGNLRSAAAALLAAAPDGMVNVRSFAPDDPRSREFVYGLSDVEAVAANGERLLAEGLHIILNETVDVADGGVSGVVQAGVIEFAPDDTPRCVEAPGVASLPLDLGLRLLETVYGFAPDVAGIEGRLEFSVHPRPRGWKGTRTLLWEHEVDGGGGGVPSLIWPNRFSRHIGDKAYGILLGHLIGLPVPETLVIARRVAPFRFGRPTGGTETWIRTCPREQEPGLFTTHKGWLDPFALLAKEDPSEDRIAAVLSQQSVPAVHSGAAVVGRGGTRFIEGVAGEGDDFMMGREPNAELPASVIADVEERARSAERLLGPVRMEWVHDGGSAWVVQLHRGAIESDAVVLVPGERSDWVSFRVSDGLEALRSLLGSLDGDTGIVLVGQVGVTSHVADLVRKSGSPARVVAA